MLKLIESPMRNPFYEEPKDNPLYADKEEPVEDMKVGIQIEHEHLPTLERVKALYEEKKEFPSIELFAQWIHDDHVKEHLHYYNDKTGLPAMERVLTQEEQKNA